MSVFTQAPGAKSTATRVSTDEPQVLFEDNHLLVLYKPAGWQTQSSARSEPDCLNWAKAYLKTKYQKSGNVFVGMVHRLDLPVSGVLVFAKTSKGASRLSESIRKRAIEKHYLAWVQGQWQAPEGLWQAYLAPDGNPCVQVRAEPFAGGLEAQMEVRLSESTASQSLVAVRLITGRKHQIRAMLSFSGHPIRGDVRYGATPVGPTDREEIALFAQKLIFDHPISKQRMAFEAPAEPWIRKWRT